MTDYILCLDQATKTTGYSVWQTEPPQMIAQGKFTYDDVNMAQRIHKVKLHVLKLIQEYKISKLYLEDIQLENQFGVTVYKSLAELIGVLQELAIENQLKIELIHSATWRSTCGIKGKRREDRKANSQKHVFDKYGLNVSDDEADAICIGEHVLFKEQCAW